MAVKPHDTMQPNQESHEYQEYDGGTIPQRKTGFWARIGGGSLSIAVLVHVILLVAGAFIIFQYSQPAKEDPDISVQGGGSSGSADRSLDHELQKKKQAQITNSDIRRVFAEGAVSNIMPLDPGINFGEASPLTALAGGASSGGSGSLGDGSGGLGNGLGGGNGKKNGLGNWGNNPAKIFAPLPEQMRKRCSEGDRLQRIKENGGTPECEEAVVKALKWLKANQNSDGSWGSGKKVAMTGFALLAYFGHCETPVSEEYGDSCLRGIAYLIDVGLRNEGRMASSFTGNAWCYEHAIATYALGEAATFMKDVKDMTIPSLAEITQKAGQFIIENQNASGGWAYSYERSAGHTDVSVTGWQIQALKACSHASNNFNGLSACIKDALDYLDKCQNENGGFGYTGPKPAGETDYFTLTGVGMLCNQMWGKGNRSQVRKGAKYVIANSKFDYNSEFSDLYGHYYESQAMMQLGGDDWKFYNAMFRDQLLKNQNVDGSWKSPGGGKKIRAAGNAFVGESADAKVYRTALCTLMLEVYYRFLSTGGGSRDRDRPGI